MPNETKGDPSGLPIPQAEYYEFAPEVHVGSWSPSPAGTPPAQYIKPSQVHLRIGTPPGRCGVMRFKGPGTLDEVIDALVLHREDVWGKRSAVAQAVLDQVRADALEEAATVILASNCVDGPRGTIEGQLAAAVRALKTTPDPIIKNRVHQ